MSPLAATLPTRLQPGPVTGTRDPAAIAVLSWTWAEMVVEPGRSMSPRWLAPHPGDANLAAHLAGHLTGHLTAASLVPCRS